MDIITIRAVAVIPISIFAIPVGVSSALFDGLCILMGTHADGAQRLLFDKPRVRTLLNSRAVTRQLFA